MYDVYSTQTLKEVKELQLAFRKKRELERTISDLIRRFEDETGLAIDMIKYQRDITLPIRGPHYTGLSIIMTTEEINA
jgi:hypothetical protein